ncbi:MAG: hypothetical protein PHY45_02430 [Rhodocyclaceae bacterium]|nr:hypothetical protein [Rhodocyclaceae bacterium]
MSNYTSAYWINGDLIAHRIIADGAGVEVVVIPSDHPDYTALVEMAGGLPKIAEGEEA